MASAVSKLKLPGAVAFLMPLPTAEHTGEVQAPPSHTSGPGWFPLGFPAATGDVAGGGEVLGSGLQGQRLSGTVGWVWAPLTPGPSALTRGHTAAALLAEWPVLRGEGGWHCWGRGRGGPHPDRSTLHFWPFLPPNEVRGRPMVAFILG